MPASIPSHLDRAAEGGCVCPESLRTSPCSSNSLLMVTLLYPFRKQTFLLSEASSQPLERSNHTQGGETKAQTTADFSVSLWGARSH